MPDGETAPRQIGARRPVGYQGGGPGGKPILAPSDFRQLADHGESPGSFQAVPRIFTGSPMVHTFARDGTDDRVDTVARLNVNFASWTS